MILCIQIFHHRSQSPKLIMYKIMKSDKSYPSLLISAMSMVNFTLVILFFPL